MEGVGARFGRSSTRYGPATVFSGPVRKWKKRWVHVSPSNNSNGSNNHSHQNHNSSSSNGNASSANGNNGSHLLLYKWTPISHRDNGGNDNNNNGSNGGEKNSVKDDTASEEPPRRKFRYIPIAVLEEQKRTEEDADNGTKPTDAVEQAPSSGGSDGKPDINDVPMEEENQDDEQIAQQDLNESILDLSLGLKAHDADSDSKTDHI